MGDRDRRAERTRAGEWVGGRFSAPYYVDEGEPYRPDIVLWIDATNDLIVGLHLDRPPISDDEVAAVLTRTLAGPVSVPPPARIRVRSEALADAVRRALGSGVHVVVGPTPDLDAVFDDLAEKTARGATKGPTYLERGRVPETDVAWLFRAAAALHRAAPWSILDDTQILRLDVPAFGVEGACMSVIGGLGQNLGFILFESVRAYDAFAVTPDGEAPRLDGYLLSLDFEPRRALPSSMQREISAHGWEVAGPKAYPLVMTLDPDGTARPAVSRDVRLCAAVTEALTKLFTAHREAIADNDLRGIDERIIAGEGDQRITVRIAFDAVAEPDLESVVIPPAARVGRNEPCPCGSGKKYKRCHLAADEARRAAQPSGAPDCGMLHVHLASEIADFAERRSPDGFAAAVKALRRLGPDCEHPQLAVPWIAFTEPFDGTPIPERFLAARAHRLSPIERDWLRVEMRAHWSAHEVLDAKPNVSITFRDLLTGAERTVEERTAARTVEKQSVVLARIVDFGEQSFLCGLHGRPLGPWDAEPACEAVRRKLRRGTLTTERMRDVGVEGALLRAWAKQVKAADRRARNLTLRNTDGEPVLITTDHFVFTSRPEVEARLATIAERHDDAEGADVTFDFVVPGNELHRDWTATLIGQATVSDGTLRIVTNSRPRADVLRALVEGACGALVRHRGRHHTDPRALARRPGAGRVPHSDAPPEEVSAIVLEFKRRHYATWVDEPVPALGNLTPRQAAARPRERSRLAVLLRDMEHIEARMPAGERFDFGVVRAALGLSDEGTE